MAKLFDVVATTGTYTDRQTGETKYLTRNVGSIIETKNGKAMVLDATFNPAGCKATEDGKVWLTLFEPREKSDRPVPSQQQSSGGDPYSEDIPFNRLHPINGM